MQIKRTGRRLACLALNYSQSVLPILRAERPSFNHIGSMAGTFCDMALPRPWRTAILSAGYPAPLPEAIGKFLIPPLIHVAQDVVGISPALCSSSNIPGLRWWRIRIRVTHMILAMRVAMMRHRRNGLAKVTPWRSSDNRHLPMPPSNLYFCTSALVKREYFAHYAIF